MEYISTRNTKKTFSFKDVFLKGLAPDGGLFIPKSISTYSFKELTRLRNLNYKELASEIILKFCNDEFTNSEIKELIDRSYKNFRTKNVVEIKNLGNKNLLELFHGPTLAFKDIAMQVIGNMYEKILKKNNLKINIVVATSGDTGAAAVSAIKDRKNIKIFVLHPDNKISEVQRKFMTTVDSSNVFNIAVDGNFDECQKLVKSMFADKNFNNSINMSGVNSINWSRIAVQIVYYFFAYFQVIQKEEKVNFAVPTGNFGDIYAGYIAKKMGLPINKLIIATNSNDILSRTINTGIYKPSKVKQTVSPSMDIQIASNFERLIFDVCLCSSDKIIKLMNDLNEQGEFKLEEQEVKKIKESFCAESSTDEETKLVIKEVFKNKNFFIDPHTAVAISAANKINLKENTIILSTAHPAKFSDTVLEQTGKKPELPENLKGILIKKEKYEKLPNDLKKIQDYIVKSI
tara:strand:+ start:1412 stop:2791 length:1380 start_codon:yes stop_codon:yes gene_type:complete